MLESLFRRRLLGLSGAVACIRARSSVVPAQDRASRIAQLEAVLREESEVDALPRVVADSIVHQDPERLRKTVRYYKGLGLEGHSLSTFILRPGVLSACIETNVAPKVNYIRSLGLEWRTILRLLRLCPVLLRIDFEEDMKPKLEVIVGSGIKGSGLEYVLRNPRFLVDEIPLEDLQRSAAYFASLGFKGRCFRKALGWNPKVLLGDNLAKVEKLLLQRGFVKREPMFEMAFTVVLGMNGDHVKTMLAKFTRYGFSEEDANEMFRKNPSIVNISAQELEKKMEYLLDKLKLPLETIVKTPAFLTYSVDQRIKPRWEFLEFLREKGYIDKRLASSTIIAKSESDFMALCSNYHSNASGIYNTFRS